MPQQQAMGIGNLAAALREKMQGKTQMSGKFRFKGRNKRRRRMDISNPVRRRRMESEESERGY